MVDLIGERQKAILKFTHPIILDCKHLGLSRLISIFPSPHNGADDSPFSLLPSSSSFCHVLKLFCFVLEFQFSVREMLLTQSSLRRPGCITLAKGYRDAAIVT